MAGNAATTSIRRVTRSASSKRYGRRSAAAGRSKGSANGIGRLDALHRLRFRRSCFAHEWPSGCRLRGAALIPAAESNTLAYIVCDPKTSHVRSEEHTSELQSLMRISYAVFCLKKKKAQ